MKVKKLLNRKGNLFANPIVILFIIILILIAIVLLVIPKGGEKVVSALKKTVLLEAPTDRMYIEGCQDVLGCKEMFISQGMSESQADGLSKQLTCANTVCYIRTGETDIQT